MTIQQPHRKTSNTYLCLVKRASVFNVFFQPEEWELWNVLADSFEGAMQTARYHFYRSRDNEILVTDKPVTGPGHKV